MPAETASARPSRHGDSLGLYLKEISRIALLTAAQERELGRKIQESGDPDALRVLVQSNLLFVVALAKRYRQMGISFEDLVNEGNLGLIEAAKRFDPAKGVRFITYATWWIRQAMTRAITDQSGPTRLPQKQARLLNQTKKASSALTHRLGRNPTHDEIAEEVGSTGERVGRLLQFQNERIPLDGSGHDEQDGRPPVPVEPSFTPTPERGLLEESQARLLEILMGTLGERERLILTLRFGLTGCEPQTLTTIGKRLGLCRERIRQLEKRAISKLQHIVRKRNITGRWN